MVEVIYTCKEGKYPFGRGKQSQRAYMEYLLQAKNQTEVNKYRQLNSIVKKLACPNIIKLQKVLKEDMCFHMIYEYHTKSLEDRLKELDNEEDLANVFVDLENVFDCLVDDKLKAQLYLQFMGVDQKNRLKVWIKPDELEFMGGGGEPDKKIRKHLLDFYQTERTRIHLQIEEIFENSEVSNLRRNAKRKQLQREKSAGNTNPTTKSKTPNFVIEGNTLVFLNKSNDKFKPSTHEQNQTPHKQTHAHNKTNILPNQQKPLPKPETNKQNIPPTYGPQSPDLSKMTVAEKVLFYKKQKQQNSLQNSHQAPLIIKDSSTSNVSQNDLSKSSNNDSNLQIKTQMINKHKMKITTSQEVEVEGNSDDDLEKMAREKIAKINKERQEKSKTHDNSMETGTKANTSGHSGDVQKLLKGLEDNSLEQQKHDKLECESKQINSKIAQAKLKAKNILQKYNEKLKK